MQIEAASLKIKEAGGLWRADCRSSPVSYGCVFVAVFVLNNHGLENYSLGKETEQGLGKSGLRNLKQHLYSTTKNPGKHTGVPLRVFLKSQIDPAVALPLLERLVIEIGLGILKNPSLNF